MDLAAFAVEGDTAVAVGDTPAVGLTAALVHYEQFVALAGSLYCLVVVVEIEIVDVVATDAIVVVI